MQRFRNHSVLAAWLILGAIVLGGGLIETHSHDEPASGKLGSAALGGGHALPDTTEHVEASTSTEGELCLACALGKRQGALHASYPASRSRMMVARSVRPAVGLAISGCNARPPAPRGPPTV